MIRITEVGPRDGLQDEAQFVPTATKVAFIDQLSQSGVDEIEVASYVSPRWVPQLADAAEVFSRITRHPGVTYSALVPNELGLDRALEFPPDEIAIFTAASETFSKNNVNTSIDGTFERFAPVMRRSRALGLPARGYLSTAFWCPYEGPVSVERVRAVTLRLLDLDVTRVVLSDTVGKAKSADVATLLDLLLVDIPPEKLVLHFHHTFGHAVGNILAAYQRGITAFDGSAGGLGGCPYAPGATGNVPTQLLVRALRDAGAEVAVDVDRIDDARASLSDSIPLR